MDIDIIGDALLQNEKAQYLLGTFSGLYLGKKELAREAEGLFCCNYKNMQLMVDIIFEAIIHAKTILENEIQKQIEEEENANKSNIQESNTAA